MILIDTSAWIEFLRDTDSSVCRQVSAALGDEFATCDAVRMELLAGARDEEHLHSLRRLLAMATILPITPAHYERAAVLYRRCRQEGATVRKLIDCLIAAVAIDAGVPVLHQDRDFDLLAMNTRLETVA